ncbi:sigma-70 family RNA polymerase sigma factor [Microlunatus speluncae]|uniref:sigma-70 family RNA polymerase sigma factor n=1 Tax=Microlunatus speluncae TaxID=2594267 RepID=UPI0013757DF4|nr:sigma-70 family RNA polymerase sigma factor [Microlunatus speluncae]
MLRRSKDGFDVAELYDGHGASVFAFALNALGDRGEAEDCVQDVFVRAWRSRHSYRPDLASLRTWLFAIARNVIIDAHRARARRPLPRDSESDDDQLRQAADRTMATLDRLIVTEALARLSREHREVVVQIRLRGLSYDTLAERTGVPVATLRTRMYYGLKSLREALKEAGESHG